MRNNLLETGRIAVFAFGIVILVVSMFLLESDVTQMSSGHIFAWCDLFFSYIVIFGPLFFTKGLAGMRTSHIVSVGIIWAMIVVYTVITFRLIAWGFFSPQFSLRFALIIQLVCVFALSFMVLAAGVTFEHADQVQIEEDVALNPIKELRTQAQVLTVRMGALGSNYADVEKKVKMISEELRYLSPVRTKAARELEDRIAMMLGTLSKQVTNLDGQGVLPEQLSQTANQILQKIKERKTMLN